MHGLADVDPEKSRRDNIGKTREAIGHLEQGQVAVAKDVTDASAGVLKDLRRFQDEKEDDLRRYMVSGIFSLSILSRDYYVPSMSICSLLVYTQNTLLTFP